MLSADVKSPNRALIKKEEVEEVINRAFGPSSQIIDHQMKPYSSEKLGLLGDYRSLFVTVQKSGCTETEVHSFFLKVVPYNIEKQASLIEESRSFYKEVYFYKSILPELMYGLKDKSWAAECYLVKDDLLVFENLKIKQFSLYPSLHFDDSHLKSCLSALAKLHASTLLAEKRLGKSMGEIYSDQLKENLFNPNGPFTAWISTSIKAIVTIAKLIKVDHVHIPKVCNLIYDLIKPSKTRRNVICHGDCKSYNIMFNDSSIIPKCVLVDFQIVRYAPAMVDVSQMIHLTTKRKYRDENEKQLLKHYHRVFCNFLRDHDEEIDLPTFSDTLEEYEEMRAIGLITATLYAPTNSIDPMLCAELMKDSEGFSKIAFDDRDDFTLELMEKNSAYKEILVEYITELVEKSKQFLKH